MDATNQLIVDLLADKERLVREKEELVDAKEKLWRGYYDIIREKDVEIERLKQEVRDLSIENERVKSKAQQAIEDLRDFMEADTDRDGDNDDDGEGSNRSNDSRSKFSNDTALPSSVPKHQNVSETALLQGLRTQDNAIPSTSPVPTKRSGISEANTNDLIRHDFAFALLVGTNADGRDLTVRIDQAAKDVHMSIRRTLKIIGKRHARRKIPSHPSASLVSCAHLWAVDSISNRRWTIESPKKYACYSCFKAGRVCLLWIGEMRWLVLPLPPQVRGDCTYHDAGFFIYSGNKNAVGYQHLWEGVRYKKKRKAPEFELW